MMIKTVKKIVLSLILALPTVCMTPACDHKKTDNDIPIEATENPSLYELCINDFSSEGVCQYNSIKLSRDSQIEEIEVKATEDFEMDKASCVALGLKSQYLSLNEFIEKDEVTVVTYNLKKKVNRLEEVLVERQIPSEGLSEFIESIKSEINEGLSLTEEEIHCYLPKVIDLSSKNIEISYDQRLKKWESNRVREIRDLGITDSFYHDGSPLGNYAFGGLIYKNQSLSQKAALAWNIKAVKPQLDVPEGLEIRSYSHLLDTIDPCDIKFQIKNAKKDLFDEFYLLPEGCYLIGSETVISSSIDQKSKAFNDKIEENYLMFDSLTHHSSIINKGDNLDCRVPQTCYHQVMSRYKNDFVELMNGRQGIDLRMTIGQKYSYIINILVDGNLTVFSE